MRPELRTRIRFPPQTRACNAQLAPNLKFAGRKQMLKQEDEEKKRIRRQETLQRL